MANVKIIAEKKETISITINVLCGCKCLNIRQYFHLMYYANVLWHFHDIIRMVIALQLYG